jgi:hypothetical protein
VAASSPRPTLRATWSGACTRTFLLPAVFFCNTCCMYHAARMPGPADYTCDIFTVGGRAGSPTRPSGHSSPPKTAASRAAPRPNTSLGGGLGEGEGEAPQQVTPVHVKVRALVVHPAAAVT